MTKNIEWMKEEIGELPCVDTVFNSDGSSYIDSAVPVMAVYDLLDQLDEPEITLDKAFEKVAESYLMTKEEVWRHLERLEAHGGKVTYDEPEVLSQKWIESNTSPVDDEGRLYVWKRDLQNVIVPKQEEVDRAYKDGYEEGREHGFYKGYREGLGNKGGEPETVADVVTTFWKSFERLKEVMSMEVEELEE